MDPIIRPEAIVRELRRHVRAKMLGIGALAVGTVGAPFILACSCPSWTARYVTAVSPQTFVEYQNLDDDERCVKLCGHAVESCELGHMTSLAPEDTGDEEARRPEVRRGPPPDNVVICEVREQQQCSIGRRPEGLRGAPLPPPMATASALGTFVAEAARLEAASVISFVQLATELEIHGAPAALIHAAERAAVDEVRHARAMSALGHELDAELSGFVVEIPAPRPLRDVLRENAVVGGVEETFGAFIAAQQAHGAGHGGVRRVATEVAADEARHAHLASVVDAWGAPLLTTPQRAGIRVNMAEARARLGREYASEPDAALARSAGLPSATRSLQWLSAADSRA